MSGLGGPRSNESPAVGAVVDVDHRLAAVELVIVGDPAQPATEALRRAVYGKSLPNKIVRRLQPDVELPAAHPAAGKGLVGGKPALYVCRNMSCEAPITEPEAFSLS